LAIGTGSMHFTQIESTASMLEWLTRLFSVREAYRVRPGLHLAYTHRRKVK